MQFAASLSDGPGSVSSGPVSSQVVRSICIWKETIFLRRFGHVVFLNKDNTYISAVFFSNINFAIYCLGVEDSWPSKQVAHQPSSCCSDFKCHEVATSSFSRSRSLAFSMMNILMVLIVHHFLHTFTLMHY